MHLSVKIVSCLLAQICLTHLWEGFFCTFLPPPSAPQWSITQQSVWGWIVSDASSRVYLKGWCTPLHPQHRIREKCLCSAELSSWCQGWLNPELPSEHIFPDLETGGRKEGRMRPFFPHLCKQVHLKALVGSNKVQIPCYFTKADCSGICALLRYITLWWHFTFTPYICAQTLIHS